MGAQSVADHLRQIADTGLTVPAAGSGTIAFNNPISATTCVLTGTLTGVAATFSGAITANGTFVRTKTKKIGTRPKAGTTAGWTVAAGNNLGTLATMAQSQTAGTLVAYICGLEVGDTITGFGVYSSINSAGGTVTLDADLRKIVIAAGASGTDSSIGTITQVSVTAATASSATKTGLSETVVAGTTYYLLLTGTTAASTTIELTDLELTVTSS